MPTQRLETRLFVDWDNNGDYVGTYDNITSDVLEVSFTRGRDYASQLSGNSISGTLTARISNPDGKYSPSNASSVLAGNMLPARPVQLDMRVGVIENFPYTFPFSFDAEPTVTWTGYLERITPTPAVHGVKTCTVTAYGSLGYLNDFRPTLETQIDKRTDEVIGAILDDVGWSSSLRELATGQTTLTRYWTDGPKTLDALRIIEETEGGFIKEGKDGKIIFENRHTRIQSPYDTPQAVFSDSSSATNSYTTLNQEDPLSTITDHVEASSRTYSTQALAVLWTHPEYGENSPFLQPGEERTYEAIYPNPSSPRNALEVSEWTTPVASTDIVANTEWNGSGTDITSSITITVGSSDKTATRMLVTLKNTHTLYGAYLTTMQARGTAVWSNDPVKVRSIDTVSQAKFGERKYASDSEFFPTSQNAQLWCDYYNSIFGSPLPILSMQINANQSDAMQQQIMARDISDRITVEADNNAGLGIDADFFIESVRQSIKKGGYEHQVTYKLSPASGGYSQFWVLDTGKIGASTVPAY